MCWYCCISLRGAVYFGTSVHIFVGLVLLVRWIVVSYIAGFVTGKIFEDTSLLILTVLSGVYLIVFITLGCFIFAGTEKQSVSILKWSSTGFTILQVLLFTLVLVLYIIAPEGWSFLPFLEPDTPIMQILAIVMYFCCLVATLNYVLVLILYTRKLWSVKRAGTSSSGGRGGVGRSSSLTNMQISHPIPHHQTALVPVTATNSTLNTTTGSSSSNTPSYYPSRIQRGNNGRNSGPMLHNHSHHHHQGPESPGIYESLDAATVSGPQHFYPANFYAGYNGTRVNSTPQPEGIYNGSASIRSSSGGSGIYYHNRPYPYPHQRYRDPIIPSTTTGMAASIASNSTLREESETPGQDWMGAYGHRLQVFQRGQQERNSATMEPLLQRQQQTTNY